MGHTAGGMLRIVCDHRRYQPLKDERITPLSRRRPVMGILSLIVLGFVVGALAKLIMPGKDPGGIITTILIGIAGAFVGAFIGGALGLGTVSGFNFKSIVLGLVGSIILLLLYRLIRKPRSAQG